MSGDDRSPARRARRPDALATRLIASALFLPCLLIIARRGGYYFLALVDIMILVGLWEFYRMMEAKGLRPYKAMGILGGLALSWYVYFQQGLYANFFLSVIFIGIMALELARSDRGLAVYHISVTVFGVFYVAWLGSHLILLRELPHVRGLDYSLGFSFVTVTFAVTWCYDTGAYFIGSLFGRHRVFPGISPGKTVEGVAGGVAFALAGAFITRALVAPYLGPATAAGLAVGGSVLAQLGDLCESMIKRDVKIKDASRTIPGHGGVLDRFDSLLFTAPLVYYVFKYVLFPA